MKILLSISDFLEKGHIQNLQRYSCFHHGLRVVEQMSCRCRYESSRGKDVFHVWVNNFSEQFSSHRSWNIIIPELSLLPFKELSKNNLIFCATEEIWMRDGIQIVRRRFYITFTRLFFKQKNSMIIASYKFRNTSVSTVSYALWRATRTSIWSLKSRISIASQGFCVWLMASKTSTWCSSSV